MFLPSLRYLLYSRDGDESLFRELVSLVLPHLASRHSTLLLRPQRPSNPPSPVAVAVARVSCRGMALVR